MTTCQCTLIDLEEGVRGARRQVGIDIVKQRDEPLNVGGVPEFRELIDEDSINRGGVACARLQRPAKAFRSVGVVACDGNAPCRRHEIGVGERL